MEKAINIKEKLKNLPDSPGVYLMYDAEGKIIYIGKAVVLKNRVRQYFGAPGNKPERTLNMVSLIADFSYIIANSELDALALEANLIKKHQPHYNILLKDGRARPYIRIDLKCDYPALEITRRVKSDGARYFGPYFAGVSVDDVVEIVRYAYKVRTCEHKSFKKNHRPCLNYHIEQCLAPCQDRVTKEDYAAALNKAMAFLSGKDSGAEETLRIRMENAANLQLFEQAIAYRDRLASLERIKARIVAELPAACDMDIFAYVSDEYMGAVSAVIVRGGKMIGCENFEAPVTGSPEDIMTAFLAQYYDGARPVPSEIVLERDFSETEAVRDYLRVKYSRSVKISAVQKGVKQRLLETAKANAREKVLKAAERVQRKAELIQGALTELAMALKLSGPPRRIECYDVSNISGTDKVAAMVVMTDGIMDKTGYRRFKIKTVEGSDDYASIRETLRRRLLKLTDEPERFPRPDLIVIDGGKGQLSSALAQISQLCPGIPLIALAEKREEVYMPAISAPLILPRGSAPLKLLITARDEAHRFAVAYHRTLRDKKLESILETIEGVGKKRRIALFKRFGSLINLKNATKEEIMETEGINAKVADAIIAFFLSRESKPGLQNEQGDNGD